MLKRMIQRISCAMTKTLEEATSSGTSSSLHNVESGKIAKPEHEKKVRVKTNKYAMMLAYQGKEYYGMQFQPVHPTIESHLLDAMLKAGWITAEERAQPVKFHFQRAARTDKAVSAVRQVCGMHLPTSNEYAITGPNTLNDLLPADIRVVAMRLATNHFHPQKNCDARTYSYTLPTFALAKPHELTNASFRVTKETLDELRSILDIYVGTHNFFNYTSKKDFADRSCNRYIMSFTCGEPFLYKDELRNEDVEFVTILVKGQSFILHQIRKMIGMTITVIRELNLKSNIQRSFEGTRMDVPKAPGLGLLLEQVHYLSYDRKHARTHEPLSDWGEKAEELVKKYKYELITKEIMESEIRHQSMLQWLADLVHHDFTVDAEAEDPESKTFVTMAASKAEAGDDSTEEQEDDEREEVKKEVKEEVEEKKKISSTP